VGRVSRPSCMINGSLNGTLWLSPLQPRFFRTRLRAGGSAQDVEQRVLVDPGEHGLRRLQRELLRAQPGDHGLDVRILEAAALLGELETGVDLALEQLLDATGQ